MTATGVRERLSALQWPDSYARVYAGALDASLLAQIVNVAPQISECPNFWVPEVRSPADQAWQTCAYASSCQNKWILQLRRTCSKNLLRSVTQRLKQRSSTFI